MKSRTKTVWSLIVAFFAVLGFIVWFYVLPNRLFHLGMNLAEIEKAAGRKCAVEGLATAFSSTPTEFELDHTPVYRVDVPSMGVKMYLNSRKQVLQIRYLFGFQKGDLPFTKPEILDDKR